MTQDRTNTRSYTYDIASMLVWYCLYARKGLPLFSYDIASLLVHYWLHDRTIWPQYCPFTPSSHGHRRYWPVTSPCSYGIASTTVPYVPTNIAGQVRVIVLPSLKHSSQVNRASNWNFDIEYRNDTQKTSKFIPSLSNAFDLTVPSGDIKFSGRYSS